VSETILYIRGPFPFGPDQPITEQLVDDAKLILLPGDEQFRSLQSSLADYKGFLNRAALENQIAQAIPDETSSRNLARFVLAIDERKRLNGLDVQGLVAQIAEWQRARVENGELPRLSAAELDLLSHRLDVFFRSLPGLERQAKAHSLSERIGQPLERIEMICDLRPVFDSTKESVEGMVPLTTLRLVVKGADGLPVAFEAVLSERHVFALAKASRDAKRKLKRLRSLLSELNIAIPDISATRPGVSDANDEE